MAAACRWRIHRGQTLVAATGVVIQEELAVVMNPAIRASRKLRTSAHQSSLSQHKTRSGLLDTRRSTAPCIYGSGESARIMNTPLPEVVAGCFLLEVGMQFRQGHITPGLQPPGPACFGLQELGFRVSTGEIVTAIFFPTDRLAFWTLILVTGKKLSE